MAGIASCLLRPSALPASAASPRAAFTSIMPGDSLLLASPAVRQPADAARSSAVVRRTQHFRQNLALRPCRLSFFSSGGGGVSSGRYVDLASPLNGSNVVLKPLVPHAQLQIQIQVQSCVRV